MDNRIAMWGKLLSSPGRASRGAALALLASLLASAPSHAARFENLYQVTVAADPTAANPRQAATALALATVLVRVTGNRNAALDPQLQSLLADQALVNEYAGLRGEARVGFNGRVVDARLRELNWPVWGSERPLTLLWIAVDDGVGGRALLSTNEPGPETSPAMVETLSGIRTELAAVANERGLPLALPLLDLEDLNAVEFLDVWGGYEDRVGAASTRYRADAVLIGRVRPGPFGNEVQWLLLKDGERRLLDGLTVRDGLDAVADLYAAELGVVGGAASTLLTVLDIGSLADYGKVMSYLDGLSVLQAVDVESFERGELRLRVTARGDARVLERVLALGGVLSPANPGRPGGALSFRLTRAGAGQ